MPTHRKPLASGRISLSIARTPDGLPPGFSVPRGLRRIGGCLFLHGSRVYANDALELRRANGTWVRGRYWRGENAVLDSLIASDRWIAYILSTSSVLRWPTART